MKEFFSFFLSPRHKEREYEEEKNKKKGKEPIWTKWSDYDLEKKKEERKIIIRNDEKNKNKKGEQNI